MRPSLRSWGRRAAWAAGLAAGLVAGTEALGFDPEPLRVALLVLIGVALVGLVVDAISREAPLWAGAPVRPPVSAGRDAATQAFLRQLESHQDARHPDAAVRDRLRSLTGQVLLVRHGLHPDDDDARARMGPELRAVLDDPPSRLTPRQIDRLLHTIEEL